MCQHQQQRQQRKRIPPAVRAVSVARGVDIALVTELLAEFLDTSVCWSLCDAAAQGFTHLVETLSAQLPPQRDIEAVQDAMDAAAECGHLETVQWLHLNRSEGCTADAMDLAAANGHLDVVQWLHAHRSESCTSEAMNLAAASGHLRVVRWLHCHRHEGCSTDAMDLAASSGHLEVVKWLHTHRDEGCTHQALVNASHNGHDSVVKWLVQFRREGDILDAIEAAAQRGNAELVQWLLEHLHLRDDDSDLSPKRRHESVSSRRTRLGENELTAAAETSVSAALVVVVS
ncbi:Intraflagellar transport protein 88 [Globisporangium polare]